MKSGCKYWDGLTVVPADDSLSVTCLQSSVVCSVSVSIGLDSLSLRCFLCAAHKRSCLLAICFQIRLYARPDAISSGAGDYALHITKRLLGFYQDYFKVQYSLPKLGKAAKNVPFSVVHVWIRSLCPDAASSEPFSVTRWIQISQISFSLWFEGNKPLLVSSHFSPVQSLLLRSGKERPVFFSESGAGCDVCTEWLSSVAAFCVHT